jgi:hypothetical protein
MLPASSCFAHVKWFVTSEGKFINTHYTLDSIALLLLSGFTLYLYLGYMIERAQSRNNEAAQTLNPADHPLYSNSNFIWNTLKFSIAILFFANIIQENFIAPNFLSTASNESQILLQATLLVVLILNVNLFSFLLACLSVSMLFIYPFESAVDYAIELFAIAISLYFLHKSRTNRNFEFKVGHIRFSGNGLNLGLSSLRLGLGIQLVILTIHDKFMHPGLALNFLEQHQNFNFIKLLGYDSFTNLHFVLAAGLAELAFGLLLITNISFRMSLSCILFFFTTSGVILGLEELMGHIPIILIAVILLFSPKSHFFQIDRIQHNSLHFSN